MDFGLTVEQKRAALISAQNTAKVEIFNILIRMGIDPDTFTSIDEIEDSPLLIGERQRLEVLLNSLVLVESKLSQIQ